VKKKKERREIKGGFAQTLLIFSLSLDNLKDFILPVINTWGAGGWDSIHEKLRIFNVRGY
jgi:hypothetical protein